MELIISNRLLSRINKSFTVKIGSLGSFTTQLLFRAGDKWSDNITAPEWGNYFDFNNRKRLTYHPKPEKQGITDTGKWKTEGRQELRLVNLVNYIWDYQIDKYSTSDGAITDPVVMSYRKNDYCDFLFSTHNPEVIDKIKNAVIEQMVANLVDLDLTSIRESDNITEIYLTRNSSEGTGTLSDSCMRASKWKEYSEDEDDYNEPFTEFYSCLRDNGVQVSILYRTDHEGNLTGRAMLWRNVLNTQSNERFSFVDRIYGNETTVAMFKEYAEIHGYYSKVRQSYSDATLELNGTRIEGGTYIIDGINKWTATKAPYMDTITYYDRKNHILTTQCTGDDRYFYWFNNTDTSISNYHKYSCACGCFTESDDIDNFINNNGVLYHRNCPNIYSCHNCGTIHSRNSGYVYVADSGDAYCHNCLAEASADVVQRYLIVVNQNERM